MIETKGAKTMSCQIMSAPMTSSGRTHGMAALQQQILMIQQREAALEQKLLETSSRVELQTVSAVDDFPIDENGMICGDDPEQVHRWSVQLQAFFNVDAEMGGRAKLLWASYISSAYPFMEGWSVENMLLALLIRTAHHRREGRCWVEYIELFCGKANLSRAAIEKGLSGLSLDLEMNVRHDILQSHGLKLVLSAITATLPGALLWVATPCSTFVILSSSVCQRTFDNNFLGNTERFCVIEGNVLADLSALVLLLGYLLELKDGLEQPGSSVLPLTPAIKAVLHFIGSVKTDTYHFNFGAPSLKPLQLWSSCQFMTRMKRDRPAVSGCETSALAEKNESSGGFTGRKELLKESQVYTLEFGRSVISALLEEWRLRYV